MGEIPTGRQYVTYDGSEHTKDFVAAIRVTLEGTGFVNHGGDVFLFGEVTATGGTQKYGLARWDQLDPCTDEFCCN